METATVDARVEVNRCSLADLIDLAQRAAHTLRMIEPVTADALRGAITQVQVETYLAG
jgi:hypothetical protein